MNNFEYANATDTDLDLWACEAMEDTWEHEMAQLRWAENGGYSAGLPRPIAPWEIRTSHTF